MSAQAVLRGIRQIQILTAPVLVSGRQSWMTARFAQPVQRDMYPTVTKIVQAFVTVTHWKTTVEIVITILPMTVWWTVMVMKTAVLFMMTVENVLAAILE